MSEGFGLGDRFHRKRRKAKPPAEPDDNGIEVDPTPLENLVPLVIYCPLRCPKCDERYPKSTPGRGKLPVHYCTCKRCGLEWHAQEVDHAGLLRLVAKRAGGSG